MNQWQALGVTLAFEVPVVFVLARNCPPGRLLMVAVTASCLTHPFVWKIASVLSNDEYIVGVWLIESCAVLVEALWYRYWLPVSGFSAASWSIVANLTSFSVGWLWQSQ
jgi:hypothetical protein